VKLRARKEDDNKDAGGYIAFYIAAWLNMIGSSLMLDDTRACMKGVRLTGAR
jgi:hypothetical protein